MYVLIALNMLFVLSANIDVCIALNMLFVLPANISVCIDSSEHALCAAS